jgi:hypothetical protein
MYNFIRSQMGICILSFGEGNVEVDNIPAVEEKDVVT